MYLEQVPQSEWPRYLQKDAQYMYRLTGIGYYPNGMATAEGTIYLRWRARRCNLRARVRTHSRTRPRRWHVHHERSLANVPCRPLNLKEKAKKLL